MRFLFLLIFLPSMAFAGNNYCVDMAENPPVLYPALVTKATCEGAGYDWRWNPDSDANGFYDSTEGGWNFNPAADLPTTRTFFGLGASDNPSFNSVHASGGNLAAANKQVVKAWQSGLTYTATSTAVVHGSALYICTSSHTAGASTEPGVGASWGTVWAIVTGAGDDLGSASASDIVALFNSGTCTGYLKSDGTCDTPASGSSAWADITGKPTTITNLGGLTPAPATPQLPFWNGTAWVMTDQLAVSEVDLPSAGSYKVNGIALSAANISAEPANANIQTHIGTTGNPHGLTITDIGNMERALDPYALKFYYGPPLTAGTCNDEETTPSAQSVASKNAWMGIGWPEANLVWICRDITAFTLFAQDSYSLTYSDAGTMTLAGGSLVAAESYSLSYSDVGSMSLEGGPSELIAQESFSLTYSDNGGLTLAGGSLFAQESYSVTVSDNGTIEAAGGDPVALYDNFNRASFTTDSPFQYGSLSPLLSPNLSTNKAVRNTGSANPSGAKVGNTVTMSNNQYARATITDDGAVGVRVKGDVGGGFTYGDGYWLEHYFLDDGEGGGEMVGQVYKLVNGARTNIGAQGGYGVAGATEISIVGTTITAKIGATTWTATDTSIAAGHPGFKVSSTGTIDDFYAGDQQ